MANGRIKCPFCGEIVDAGHGSDECEAWMRAKYEAQFAKWREIPDAVRLLMMAECCRYCGCLDPRCQCGNDE